MIDQRLLDLLICPISGGPLQYNALTHSLDSDQAGVRFPIINGIPHLLVSDAQPLNESADDSADKSID